MPKLTLQVRTGDNLLNLLAAGESHAWHVAHERESLITHVQIVSLDGSQMIRGVYDRNGSSRRESDDRLIIRFLDGEICNCQVRFDARNPVRFLEDGESLDSGEIVIHGQSLGGQTKLGMNRDLVIQWSNGNVVLMPQVPDGNGYWRICVSINELREASNRIR